MGNEQDIKTENGSQPAVVIIRRKIKEANSIKALNALRMDVVKLINPSVLQEWQDKYWAFKKCLL